MTRSFMAVVVVGFASMALAPVGCSQTGVGDPCVPEQEYDPTFAGFDPGEVNVESKSFDCETRLCLANHFQGRVTCPYGQTTAGGPPAGPGGGVAKDADGNPIGVNVAAAGAAANVVGCVVPGTTQAVTGQGGSAGSTVQPQCLQRLTSNAVYCSCHCANTTGRTTARAPRGLRARSSSRPLDRETRASQAPTASGTAPSTSPSRVLRPSLVRRSRPRTARRRLRQATDSAGPPRGWRGSEPARTAPGRFS